MFIYALNYIICAAWAFVRNQKLAVLFIGSQMFLLLAMRSDNFGVDLDEYKMVYTYYMENSFSEIVKGFHFFSNADVLMGRESGYVLLNWLCGNLGLSFHSFLILQSAICILSLCWFINKYSKIPWLSFALFIALGMYAYMFCIVRQSIAAAILYFAFPYIKNRNFWKFLLVVVLASLFHFIALSFLPLYWLGNKIVSLKTIAIGAVLSFLLPVLLKGVVSVFLSSLGKNYVFFNEASFNSMMILIPLMLFFLLFFYKRLNNSTVSNESIIFWGFFWSLPVQMFSLIMPILGRASIGIYLPLVGILIPNLIWDNEKSESIPFLSLLTFCGFFMYYLAVFLLKDTTIIPYQSYYF